MLVHNGLKKNTCLYIGIACKVNFHYDRAERWIVGVSVIVRLGMNVKKESIESGKIFKLSVVLEDEESTHKGGFELDFFSQPEFLEIINERVENWGAKLLFDMGNISYMDSSGLWTLVELHKKTSQAGGVFVLLNPMDDIKSLLDMTDLVSKLVIFEDEKKAIEYLLDAG